MRLPKQKWSGFMTYCKRLCNQSLITGFPVIASTRNVLHKFLKIFVFALCTCGFLYQTSGFLNLYWAYPTMTPKINFLAKMNRSLEYVKVLGQRPEDLIAGCSVRGDEFSPCTNIVTVLIVNNEGFPNSCVAIETLWGQPDGKQQKLPVTGQISILLTLKPEDYVFYFDLVLAHVFMHEGHGIGNPVKEGITLEAGKTYDIFVNKRVTVRLPAPYKTNCTDYLQLWRQNGGYGPLTGKACAEKCKMEYMVKEIGCVHQSVVYPTNYTICEDKGIFPSEDILKKCSLECNEACWPHVDLEIQFVFDTQAAVPNIPNKTYSSYSYDSYGSGQWVYFP
ncbi:uncharacterized protein NPIL_30491 [Nephila pilipes]|uniref:Uncharacterized protein n=1 Tax=Nephila pilipes TaxID=299642 RepID=A0A8X6NN51_NEPPI|nr:uncharacterized protein NPIL_30491 [Nephila pilipes]